MVVSVCHFTNQVEIAGGGHAPILSGARGPAPPPSAGPRAPDPKTIPIPSLASDSCISIRIGGNDVPFLFHSQASLAPVLGPCENYPSSVCSNRSRLNVVLLDRAGGCVWLATAISSKG